MVRKCLLAFIILFIAESCSVIECETPATKQYNFNFKFETLSSGTKKFLKGIDFVTPELGFISGSDGIILKTTDGGKTFTQLNSGTSNNLYRIKFTSPKIGYAIGDNLTLIKSEDGGNTWSSLLPNVPGNHLRAIQFFNDTTGIVAGVAGRIYSTFDGGKTWSLRAFPSVSSGGFDNRNIYSMHWTDMEHGFLGCNFGDFVYCDGSTFKQIPLGISIASSSAIWDMQVMDETAYIAASQHSNTAFYNAYANVIKTEDLWSDFSINYQHASDSMQFWGIEFYDKIKGLVVGGNQTSSQGYILTTLDGGTTWNVDTLKTKMLANIEQIDGRIFIVGDSGVVLSNKLE
jgi:photosystem II stability/assembly factor-like uncharacterized protein